MAKAFNGVVLDQVRALFEDGSVGGLSDGELLGRFLDDRGASGEAAFGALVLRHGPLVFGICRRALKDEHQSEDAFQATFLVLARNARSIRNREAVGAWLAGVAGKVAARARGDALRRRAREGLAAGQAPRWSAVESADDDEVALLLWEVDRLRRPLREALVLCHLQGHTYDSAAEALKVSEGTIRGRLARAREILRVRLGRRGVGRDASASLVLAPRIFESVPARLASSTARGAVTLASGRPLAGLIPGPAITLMEGVLKAMGIARLKLALPLILGIGLLTSGVAVRVHARQKPGARPAEAPAKVPASDAPGLADVVGGKVVRSAEVTKDCMVLSYLPDWAFGNVDNIGIANNDGGVRTIVDWPDVPESEARSGDLKFYLAFYSRKTTAKPKPGSIHVFEVVGGWPEATSWKTRPALAPDPLGSTKFEPGEGWKAFEITSIVRDRGGKSGHGLMFRFLEEDRTGYEWSGYEFVSREGNGEWAGRRPMLVVVEPAKK